MNKTITLVALAAILAPGILRAQNINTVVGTPTSYGYSGDGGQATNAQLAYPEDVKFDGAGNMYICDGYNQAIRKVNTSGVISTFAGGLGMGYTGDGGQATAAELDYPAGLAVDASGNVYISVVGSNVIRKVNTSGIISTIAGSTTGFSGYMGDGGQATAAELDQPNAVAFDKSGNMYISDLNNQVIRKINTAGVISTVAGNNLSGSGYNGDGTQATNAQISYPDGVAVDAAGNLYIADQDNNVIRKVNTAGVISTYAGNYSKGAGFSGDGGAATAAELNSPAGLVIDADNNLFIADQRNYVVRRVDNTGKITTVAGNNFNNYSGDGGPATLAEIAFVPGVGLDKNNLLYIADYGNSIVRQISKPLAIDELNTTNMMTVYPNPSNGAFTIEMKSEKLKVKSVVDVYDMLGAKVYSTGSVVLNSGYLLNLKGVSNGIYLLKVTSEDGSETASRIEIAR